MGETLYETLAREVESLKDHLGDGGTLQIGRVRLWQGVLSQYVKGKIRLEAVERAILLFSGCDSDAGSFDDTGRQKNALK